MIKTITLTAIGGMLLAGLLAVIVSEIDGYYDWLLVKQSVWIGLLGGLVTATAIIYFKRPNQHFPEKAKEDVFQKATGQPSGDAAFKSISPKPQSSVIRLLKTIARISLGGVVGLILGLSGGIWYCSELFNGLSSEAQAWIIFYLPFYAITAVFCGVLGCGAGALTGMLFGFFKSARN